MKSNRRAMVVPEILGGVRFQVAPRRRLAISHGNEEKTFPVKRQAGSVMPVPLRHGFEDLLHVGQAIVLESATNHGRGGLFTPADWLRIAEVNQTVRGEVRVKGKVQ
jgi:hypothetical protein